MNIGHNGSVVENMKQVIKRVVLVEILMVMVLISTILVGGLTVSNKLWSSKDALRQIESFQFVVNRGVYLARKTGEDVYLHLEEQLESGVPVVVCTIKVLGPNDNNESYLRAKFYAFTWYDQNHQPLKNWSGIILADFPASSHRTEFLLESSKLGKTTGKFPFQ